MRFQPQKINFTITGGTLVGEMKGNSSIYFKCKSLSLTLTSIWEFGINGSGFSLHQGGVVID
jgi:hypothetical protein